MMDYGEKLLPYKEHLNEIKEALLKKDAYLFIGAGFSLNGERKTTDVHSSFKTWTVFMEQLARKLWPGLDDRELEKKVAGNHLYIAQLYEEEFGTSAFYKELLQAVPYRDYIPSAIHRELIGMDGWKGFITTNQDCLIEQTLDQLHIYHDVIISDLDISTKPAATKVIKLHGSMERPESIIFTEEQYRTYEQKHPLLHIKAKSIFAEHCVVFVGFSLTDANFKVIYGWVKDVLQSDYQRKAYAFVLDRDIDPYTKRYWEKRNIILLPIFTRQYRNTATAFKQSLKAYIDVLMSDEEGSENGGEISQLYPLLDKGEWKDEYTKEFLRLVDNVPQGQDFQFAEKFIGFMKKLGADLNEEDLFLLLEAVYQKRLLSPFYSIEGRTLIDRLIDLLEKDFAKDDLLYKYLLEKSEWLLCAGEYEKLEQLTKNVLEKDYSVLPVDVRNSFLYLQIIIEKYRMDFESIHSLIRQFVIDWEQPLWLNRLASLYLFLGEKSMALNLYNRAIQVADEKRDDWNQYLAYLSKLYIMCDFLASDSFQENEKREVQQSVRRLAQRLKEMKHPTFERWQQFDELKARWWSDYKNWKGQLGRNQIGFNSFKGEAFYNVYEMIYFYEMNGFPPIVMTGKKFDVIMDIFIENNKRVEGTSLAILLGHDKQLKHAYRFEMLSEVTEDERTKLYQQSIDYAENIIWYIHSLRINSFNHFVELWLPALIQFWTQFVPILKDEEIEQISEYCFTLFNEIQALPSIDSFANARNKLISLLGRCLFYRQHAMDQTRIFEILQKAMDHFRLVDAFSKISWHDFVKGSIPDDVVDGILGRIDDSSVNLVYEWLDEELLTESQKQLVFDRIYDGNEALSDRGEKELLRARFLYLKFFTERLNYNDVKVIIGYGIKQFRSHLSSSNTNELYQLAQHVGQLEEPQVREIIEEVENKINFAASKSNVLVQEIASFSVYFLNELRKAGKLENSKFIEAISKVEHLEINKANMVAELAHDEQFTKIITAKLLEASYSYQVNVRKDGCLLIGFWLKERNMLEEIESNLLERLLVALDDSNVEVASEAVRGIAFVLKDNPSFLPVDVLNRIVRVTERGIRRTEISYLTNLAFLYKELSDRVDLSEPTEETVKAILTTLSQSSYSNVRRECHL